MRHSAFVIMRHATERLLYGDLLGGYGFDTLCLSSMSEARGELSQAMPDVLLLDLDDTHNDDLEFLRLIRRTNRLISVIGFTAWPQTTTASTLAACDVCLQIPVTMAEVVSTVRHSLKSDSGELLASA